MTLGPNGDPIPKKLPEWAEALHAAGAWKWMAARDVRRVHFDSSLQDALLSAHRLGGELALMRLVEELIGEDYHERRRASRDAQRNGRIVGKGR